MSEASNFNTDKRNILLIEDNPGDAKLVEIYLRESPSINFELFHVMRLSDGFELAKKENFDIVLLDLTLPDTSGFDTLTKATKGFPSSISIVVLTGIDDEKLGVKAVEAGAQDYLVKGQIDTSSLTRSVLHAIERRKIQLQLEQTAKNLLQSEHQLLQAQRIAQIGNYELELSTGEMYWSEEVYRIFGLNSQEVASTFENYLQQVGENVRESVKAQIQAAIDDDSDAFMIEHLILSNGTRKFVRNQGKVEFDPNTKAVKIIGTIQNITQYKTAQELLVQSQERYRTVFEESQDAIYITTTSGRFSEKNESLVNMFGFTHEEFQNIVERDLYVSASTYDEFLKKMEASGSVKDFEVKMKTKTGAILDCLVSSNMWYSVDGSLKGYHGLIRDVTALKKNQELIQAKELAERTAAMRERFLANMSHEIRTPMNVVVGMTHLLENTGLNEKQREYLSALNLSSDNLLKLINSILDFSKIESGKIELENRPFGIQDLMNDLVQTHKFKAKEKSINLFTLVDVNLPTKVIGDSVRLQSIINNLVSNAIKYTDKGEVVLRAQVLDDTDEYIEVQFSVKDTGIGIAIEKQQRIFEAFAQASNSTERLYGGTGLGLSIAKQLTELFGGKMQLESEAGRGSTFSFTIKFSKDRNLIVPEDQVSQTIFVPKPKKIIEPIESDQDIRLYTAEDNISEEEMQSAGSISVNNHINILLVEDHKLNQLVATDLLKKWSNNMTLDVAENGQEAVAILEKDLKQYDVILMDISMPIMDGFETTKYIRNQLNNRSKTTPIIAMTAHAFNRHAERCFEVGMNEFVSKPINPQVLYAKLNKILGLNKQKQASTSMIEVAAENEVIMPLQEKMINLDYLDTLTGGDFDIKISMLETLVRDIPGEIDMVVADFENRNWGSLKQSSHKIKSTCAYIGLTEMSEVSKEIEHGSWERKDLEKENDAAAITAWENQHAQKIGQLVKQLATICRRGHKELIVELESLQLSQTAK